MKRSDSLYRKFADGKKKFAPLIDPDKYSSGKMKEVADLCESSRVDFILYGGSLLIRDHFESHLDILKSHCQSPVILFPGSFFQVSGKADGILLLSMISGRNPDLLIGNHVIAAPYLRASGLEILPTGYVVIGDTSSAVAYMSHSAPIPSDKEDIAASTAMAGEMMGLKIIYLEAGSGAAMPVPPALISRVRQSIDIPLIAGGGIRTVKQARAALDAGADTVVVGNALEKDPGLIRLMTEEIHK